MMAQVKKSRARRSSLRWHEPLVVRGGEDHSLFVVRPDNAPRHAETSPITAASKRIRGRCTQSPKCNALVRRGLDAVLVDGRARVRWLSRCHAAGKRLPVRPCRPCSRSSAHARPPGQSRHCSRLPHRHYSPLRTPPCLSRSRRRRSAALHRKYLSAALESLDICHFLHRKERGFKLRMYERTLRATHCTTTFRPRQSQHRARRVHCTAGLASQVACRFARAIACRAARSASRHSAARCCLSWPTNFHGHGCRFTSYVKDGICALCHCDLKDPLRKVRRLTHSRTLCGRVEPPSSNASSRHRLFAASFAGAREAAKGRPFPFAASPAASWPLRRFSRSGG